MPLNKETKPNQTNQPEIQPQTKPQRPAQIIPLQPSHSKHSQHSEAPPYLQHCLPFHLPGCYPGLIMRRENKRHHHRQL